MQWDSRVAATPEAAARALILLAAFAPLIVSLGGLVLRPLER